MHDFKSDILVILMFVLFVGGIAWLSYQSRKNDNDTSDKDKDN